jgi:hypothetical protein
MKQKKTKPVQAGATDLSLLKVCVFDELRITTLDRIKINQMPDADNLKMLAVAGSRFSCVVATRSRLPIENLKLQVKGKIPCDIYPVESVIFPEEATLIPDLLSEQKTINVGGNTTAMFLLVFDLPEDIKCQDYNLTVTAQSTTHQTLSKDFELEIIAPPKSKQTEDHKVIFWPHWKRFASHFNIELWSEEFWDSAEKYLKEMASGGMNVIMASINHDPFCYPLPEEYYEYNYYPPMVIWHRDKTGKFTFDFSIYDRYVELNLSLGIDKEIECHALLPCKQQDPKIIYYDIESKKIETIETVHNSPLYKEAWTAFLKAFINHNRQRGWHNMLTICPYDEPCDPKQFAEVVKLVRNFAPEIKISAAITSSVALSVLDHIDIATIHLEAGYSNEAVEKLRKNGIELRWYNCCTPDWGNTLFNCKLIDSYRISWITEKGKYKGFLRWSITDWPHAWNINPGFNWPTGDTYLISPGKNGPMETLRWHTYKQGLQDLKLLKQLNASAKIENQFLEIGVGHKLYDSKTPGEFQQNLYSLIKQKNTMLRPPQTVTT